MITLIYLRGSRETRSSYCNSSNDKNGVMKARSRSGSDKGLDSGYTLKVGHSQYVDRLNVGREEKRS